MTAQISHAPDVIVLDTSGQSTSVELSTPDGQVAIAAGGTVCSQDRDENDVPFWVPAPLGLGVAISGDTATFWTCVYNGRNMCIRDAWISYWED